MKNCGRKHGHRGISVIDQQFDLGASIYDALRSSLFKVADDTPIFPTRLWANDSFDKVVVDHVVHDGSIRVVGSYDGKIEVASEPSRVEIFLHREPSSQQANGFNAALYYD